MQAQQQRCIARVTTDNYSPMHQCTRNAVPGNGGYCKQHDPVAVAAKVKRENDAWHAEQDRAAYVRKCVNAHDDLVAALRMAETALTMPIQGQKVRALRNGNDSNVLDAIRAALAKAQP